jgi:hypothetical protein
MMRELDKFETIGAGGVVGGYFSRRRIMRKRTHREFLPLNRACI